ncbi:MAG: zinc-ribbon domain-containing protein [Eggerthellaceae bacterium]|jgi:hypothetical protein
MIICPNCNTENRDGAKYCNECGFPLVGKLAALARAVDEDKEKSEHETEVLEMIDTKDRAVLEAMREEDTYTYDHTPATDEPDEAEAVSGEEGEGLVDAAEDKQVSPEDSMDTETSVEEEAEPGAEDRLEEDTSSQLNDSDYIASSLEERTPVEEGSGHEEKATKAESEISEANSDEDSLEESARETDNNESSSGMDDASNTSVLPTITDQANNEPDSGMYPHRSPQVTRIKGTASAFSLWGGDGRDRHRNESDSVVIQPQAPAVNHMPRSSMLDSASIPKIILNPDTHSSGQSSSFESSGSLFDEEGNYKPDLSGFDRNAPSFKREEDEEERLVDSDYVPPQKVWRSGETMQLPVVERTTDKEAREFQAPENDDKDHNWRKVLIVVVILVVLVAIGIFFGMNH